MHILLLIDITKTEDWGAGWLAGSLSDYSANSGFILQAETCEFLRGRFKIKNTIICGKSPKGGGGVRAKIKKVYISNVDSL